MITAFSLAVMIYAGAAGAASFTIGGPAAEATVRTDNTRALYASGTDGQAILITEVGADAPNSEAKFTELGVPAMTADGKVLFGAELMGKDKHPYWDVYIGDPSLPPNRRATPALQVQGGSIDCVPRFRGDPYPVADSQGEIAFTSPESGGRDTLFLYSGGKLVCLARTGDVTKQGHTLSVLSFGTVQAAQPGQVVFTGFLKGEKQAVLAVSRAGGIEELAVEGEIGPGRAEYEHGFGLPAALGSPDGMVVAFTAKNSSGNALYLYRDGKMARILTSGTLTPVGPVTYFSPGRPGLMADGTTAVLTGCARVPAIFRLTRGRLDLTIQRGQMSPLGTALVSLGDPVLTASGVMFLGAIDALDQEKLYKLTDDNGLSEVGETAVLYNIAFNPDEPPRHSIFTGTLTVNQRGDFAYLGGK